MHNEGAVGRVTAEPEGFDTFPDEDDGLEEGEEFGAELGPVEIRFINGSSIEFVDGDGGSFSGLEFIGDVGRNPFPDPNVND